MENVFIWITGVFNWFMGIIQVLGYPGIFICMTIESSFIPFPSEIIVPPAGYLAAQGKMNIFLVILAGTLGSLAGAYINYFLALKLGRAIIIKWGSKFHMTEERFAKVEKYFNEHGAISTFVGRLLVGIRQYISIPAGLTKMDLKIFTLFTFLGAAIWNAVLAWIGFTVGNNMHLIKEKSHEMSLYALVGIVIIITGYIIWKKNGKKLKNEK